MDLDQLTLYFTIALAVIMLGLGLSLKVGDFIAIKDNPKAIIVALFVQVVILPAICFVIAITFGLIPALAAGLMILAASPGGVTANLFSHLFGGNVPMNITLTAINTILAIIFLPLVANFALGYFKPEDTQGVIVPLQFGKVAQVILVILIPVMIGMAIRYVAPSIAQVAQKPFKIFSAVLLALLAFTAIYQYWDQLMENIGSLGPAVIVFNLVSLLLGYVAAKMIGVDEGNARAISFEIGIHNTTLAFYIAFGIIKYFPIGVPAAVYSITMYVIATLFGFWLKSRKTA